MALSNKQKQQMVAKLQAVSREVWDVVHEATEVVHEWNAGGYSSGITALDLSNLNITIDLASIQGMVTTLTSVSTVLNNGNDTNLAKGME